MSQKWEIQRGSSRVRVDRKQHWKEKSPTPVGRPIGVGRPLGWSLGELTVPLPRVKSVFGF